MLIHSVVLDGLSALTGAIMVGYHLTKGFSRPIKLLLESISHIRMGIFPSRLPIVSNDELGILIDSFNQMVLELQDKKRLSEEISSAKAIQKALLPQKNLYYSGIKVFGFCEPASEVGGDYYDFFVLPNDRLGFIIGDTTGHGLAPALLMAMTKSFLISQMNYDSNPERIIDELNRFIISYGDGRQMSCCFGIIDSNEKTMEYVVASHPYPLLLRENSITQLNEGCPLLGILDNIHIKPGHIKLKEHDRLILCSDGIYEIPLESGNLGSYSDWLTLLESLKNLSSEKIYHHFRTI